MKVKFCKDCKYSVPEKDYEWNLRCQHPTINAKDPWALAYSTFTGSNCRDERSRTWWAKCGQKGKLWEQKA